MEPFDVNSQTALYKSDRPTNKRNGCSMSRVWRLFVFVILVFLLGTLIVFTVINSRKIGNLRRRVDGHNINDKNTASQERSDEEQRTLKEVNLENKINETNKRLLGEISSIDVKIKMLQEDVLRKQNGVYFNESVLKLNEDVMELEATIQNVTKFKKYSDASVQRLDKILVKAKYDLSRLENDLSLLHANHTELDRARDVLVVSVKNLTKKLADHDKYNAVTTKDIQGVLNITRQKITEILQMLSWQNSSSQNSVEMTAQRLETEFDAKLAKLSNLTAAKMRVINATVEEIEHDHREAHKEFKYWNKTLDAMLGSLIKTLSKRMTTLETSLENVKRKQSNDKKDFETQMKATRDKLSNTETNIDNDMKIAISGLTAKVSTIDDKTDKQEDSLTQAKSNLVKKIEKLEIRIKKLENKSSGISHINILLLSTQVYLIFLQYT